MTSPLKAIRTKCLDCCNNSRKEVKLCPCDDCALWPFRFGTQPKKPNESEYKEYTPKKKEGAVWAIRTWDWKKVVYVFEQGENYVVEEETFTELEWAKQKAREEIKRGMDG